MIARKQLVGQIQTPGGKPRNITITPRNQRPNREILVNGFSSSDLQNAFGAASSGSIIVVPPGRYLMTSAVSLTGIDDLHIIAHGALFIEDSGDLTSHFAFTSCDRLLFEGPRFEAGEDDTYFQANSPTAANGRPFIDLTTCDDAFIAQITGKDKRNLITADSCLRLKVRDFSFSGFAGTVASPNTTSNQNFLWCINAINCDYVSVSGGHVIECGSSFLSQTSSTHITASNVSGRDLHDNGLYISSGTHIAVGQCSFINCAGDGIQARGDYISLTGNILDNCDDVGISVTPLSTAGVRGSCSVIGNMVNGCDLGIRAVQNTNEPADVVISNNVVLDTKLSTDDGAIAIGSQTGRVTITGNVVHTSETDVGIAIGDVGTVTSHLVVSNNVVSDINGSAANTRGGIRLDDCTNFVANGNVFSDVASAIGVRCRTCSDGVVANNVYDGAQVVRIPSGESNTGIFVHGNRGDTVAVDGPANNTVGMNLGDTSVSGGQTYSESNVTTDRTYDANATSVAELADVLGTLIDDLRSAGFVQ